jgi:hypothetical protein
MTIEKEKTASAKVSKKTVRKPRRPRSPKGANGRTPKGEHAGKTQTVCHRFKGSRTWFEFEITFGQDKGPLKVHRVQIGRKPGENETKWAIRSLGENKIKNIVIEILKKERIIKPLEVPTFSESIFS